MAAQESLRVVGTPSSLPLTPGCWGGGGNMPPPKVGPWPVVGAAMDPPFLEAFWQLVGPPWLLEPT